MDSFRAACLVGPWVAGARSRAWIPSCCWEVEGIFETAVLRVVEIPDWAEVDGIAEPEAADEIDQEGPEVVVGIDRAEEAAKIPDQGERVVPVEGGLPEDSRGALALERVHRSYCFSRRAFVESF